MRRRMKADYASVLAVAIVFFIGQFDAASCVVLKLKPSKKVSLHPVVLVVSFDGFRYDYWGRTPTPNMDKLRESTSSPYMRNQFVTKTFPNHMSIATGLHVESHGITGNYLYDPAYRKVLTGMGTGPDTEKFWRFNDQVLPLWTLNELAGNGRASGVMMWPGGNIPYGKNKTLPSYHQVFDESISFEERVDKVISWITDPQNPANMVFLYFEEPDELAHAFGPESTQVDNIIKRLDNVTGYLLHQLEDLGIEDKVNMIFLSDHGFHEVKQNHIINITTAIPQAHMYKRFGSSPVLNISPHKGKSKEVYDAFKNYSVGRNFSVYHKSSLDPNWYYSRNRRIMPIVLVADLGYVFDDFWQYIEDYNIKYNITPSPDNVYGTHGYNNREMSMHPIFFAKGPALQKGVFDPFDNIDLYPLICKIIGLNPMPNNGTFHHVSKLIGTQSSSPLPSSLSGLFGAAVLLAILVLAGLFSLFVVRVNVIRHRPLVEDNGSIRWSHDNLQINEIQTPMIEELRVPVMEELLTPVIRH